MFEGAPRECTDCRNKLIQKQKECDHIYGIAANEIIRKEDIDSKDGYYVPYEFCPQCGVKL